MISEFKRELLNRINEYCDKYEIFDSDILKTCTVLDPKYKRLSFIDSDKEKKKWYSIAQKTIAVHIWKDQNKQ